jgi:hypothetical protein
MLKRNRKQTIKPPTGLCLDERNGLMVIADFTSDGGFDIHRAVVEERRAVNITSPELRTVVRNASAHSQFAQIAPTAADSDETIISALLAVTSEDHGLIANFTRAIDGRILLTQADELAVSETNQRLETWLDAQQPTHVSKLPYMLRVETRTRALARVWHSSAQPEIQDTVVFLLLGADDYALALWTAAVGFAYETEELFEPGATAQLKCRHAADMLARFIGGSTINDLNLPSLTRIVVSAIDDYQPALLDTLLKAPELAHIEISPISLDNDAPLDQAAALAIGALLDDSDVPMCDLNVALDEQLEDIRRASANHAQSIAQTQAMRAVVALLIPIVALAAFAITSYADRVVERVRLQSRLNQEEIVAKKLERENADYESSKQNFAAFQSLLNNLIALRQRQPASERLLRDLNQRWPHEPSWFVSEITVKGPAVEIKGKTRSEQAIATFAKSLEFSDGLFTNILTKNNVQGATPNPSQPFPLSPSLTTPSNIIEFTVNATYAPLAGPGKATTSDVPSTSVAQTNTIAVPPPAIRLATSPGSMPANAPPILPPSAPSPQPGVK